MPDRAPPVLRVSPGGSTPALKVKAYGLAPPVTDKPCINSKPTVADTKSDEVKSNAPVTVIVYSRSTFAPLLSLRRTRKVTEPGDCGDPVMIPVAGSMTRPAGSAPDTIVKVYG